VNPKAPSKKPEPIRTFRTRQDFASWLEKNHGRSSGIWARIAKKGSGLKSMTYLEGLDTALCYGWIDALKRPENESAWLQRFVPRRKASLWSKINREKALRLIERGEMRPPGLAEIERAKGDGRWEAAYDSPARAMVPPELEAELARRPKAKQLFDSLDRINRYAIIWRVQTAKKPETRARRIATLVEMLEKGKKLH
jgi:uncharacterized protein YdeI (YjbR/CyaY-like superfamily)